LIDEEAAMRPWFYLDKLNEQDRATVKRWHLRVIGGYAVVAVLVVAMVAMQTNASQMASFAANAITAPAQAAGQ
jgi:hypothetical protein